MQTKTVALAAPRSGPLVKFHWFSWQSRPGAAARKQFHCSPIGSTRRLRGGDLQRANRPGDNYGVYQASIDDVPMIGHGTMTAEYPNIATPVVFDAVNQGSAIPVDPYRYPNAANSRFVSYTFLAVLPAGTHTMRIKVAGCCSNLPGGFASVFVRAATAVIRY
jgi:hypothetical protein